MLHIVELGFSKDTITAVALKVIAESNIIFVKSELLEIVKDLISDKEIIENDYELAILKSKSENVVVLGDYRIANIFYQIAPKYGKIEIKSYCGTTTYLPSLIGAPLDDFAIINFGNNLISESELFLKAEYALKANFVLMIYNPLDKLKDLIMTINGENCFIGVFYSDSYKIIRVKNIKNFNNVIAIIVGNKLSYKKLNKLISPMGYVFKQDIHELSCNHYEKLLDGSLISGSNLDCEYYPCHYEGQCCDFCYCPFYPCGDSSTGGYWIKDKGVWSCENCLWIHDKNTIECLRKPIEEIILEVDDLNNKKEELLKLRRRCRLNII